MATKVYVDTETAILYGSEVGDDVAWSTENISDGAGRWSDYDDRGAAPRTDAYFIEFWAQAQATPTAQAACRVAAAEGGSETATPDHPVSDEAGTDGAVSAEDKLLNTVPVGAASVDEAAADTEFGFKQSFVSTARHLGFVLWNAMGSATTNDAAETKLRLTPKPPSIQDA